LATLRGRVDALEARTAELEANQFSTTTKLRGEAIFSVSQAFGDKQAVANGTPTNNLDSNITFSNRVRLSLESSFMGTDVLQTRLNAGNFTSLNTDVTGTPMTQLGYESVGDNSVAIDKLNYTFNLSEKVRVRIDAVGGELNENVNVFNPDFRSSGTGALSRYGRFSPIYRLADDGAGITVNVNPQGALTLSAAYFARGRNQAANPAIGEGLFDGSSTIFGQLAFKPNKALNLGFTYAQSYQTADEVNLLGNTGSATVNINPAVPVESNNYGLQFTFNPSAKITLGGWAGYTTANTVTGPAASADIWYWAATLGLKDFGREGNTLGLVFGQPPKVTGGSGGITKEASTSYHLEGLYKMKVSDNILITPGLLVIFNPEHNDKNDTIYVGTLRTTFSF
ncbi:MAG: iron uptake porin, partial [Sphaerospermopsis kisseleviana]